MWAIVEQSALALFGALRDLLAPALFFFLLAMLLRGRAVFHDIRRVWPETRLNLELLAFNALVVVPLIGLVATFLATTIQSRGLVFFDPADWARLPTPLVIFIVIFIGDFVGYWRHRLEHSVLLWPSHAVHHSDTAMTWLTLERFHPINRVTTFVIDASVLILLGAPPFAIVANSLVRHYYGFLIHADLPWTYGRLGRIFVSPAMHRWHHAADAKALNTNYATVFSVFDQLFGTFRVPGPCTAPLGILDDLPATFGAQLGYAFRPNVYRKLMAHNARRRANRIG
ncbi:sterol desaturase family protein [Defluviimonas sp. D31]|uniref:sterol desaturase family protein n=1 Tax=Defluviimonas sp. D31 TaxID=3083253 RepID=UPI00296F4031|nr:sterol desaturase family protein [Defluviimonas sp. D31]MDW4549375.1 sterol desaturase family protein [Defluviimonas sp. D31]